ncbi:MAG: carbamoyltransferase HypF [Actinobacteria bacterium]|nr:carbamoyltransferase HypF [Actinomycetota bacterium]
MTSATRTGPGARTATAVRRLVRVTGVVQGVGFRPFVYGLAAGLSLTGSVLNDAAGVLADVQGAPADVEEFCRRVRTDAPALSAVDAVTWEAADPLARNGFTIESSAAGRGRTLVPADVATCDDCLRELTDPADRRYRHPFVTCTACGPRFTIVTGLPYDRPSTTMAGFGLCDRCAAEYADPADRRFHAQPVACHDCGPVLDLVEAAPDPADPARPVTGEAALARARALLAAGRVVAVKGLGGYHLACDATSPEAVQRLRERKQRGDKPFAVLVRDVAAARAFCHVDDAEAALLVAPRRPVVLLRRRADVAASGAPAGSAAAAEAVAEAVAPGNPDLGVMLPPTGLHHLLLGLPGDAPGPQVLVLTSGNLSSEPIVTDDAAALTRLAGIADAWLRHDRPIHVPCDDSVSRVVDGEELPLRRSRGYAPLPVALPVEVGPTLAVGGDLKNTFCVAEGGLAWLSAHVGDMDDLATQQAFEAAVEHLGALTGVTPRALAADRHPAYRSTRWAERTARARALPLTHVQHHHAHVAAVMAEHGLAADARVVGVAFDGTGYGDDGTGWGGEVLVGGYLGYERVAHLSTVPLPGGDSAVHRPYRMALAHLHAADVPWEAGLPCVDACPDDERAVLAHQVRTGLACVPTSSAGRLFDAVASLAGLCHVVTFEAQAAMALEAAAVRALAADASPDAVAHPLPLVPGPDGGAAHVLDCGALVRAVAADVRAGVPADVVALRFHRGLAAGVVAAGAAACATAGLDTVALSGGVFCNATLLSFVTAGFATTGLTVLRHRRVPPNDGGLALGQVVVAGLRRATPGSTTMLSTTTNEE